jgi:Tos1-like cell wall protein
MNVRHVAKWLLLAAPVGLAMCAGSQGKPGSDGGANGVPVADASPSVGAGSGDAAAAATSDAAPSDAGTSSLGETSDGQSTPSVPADCPASDVGNTALGTDTPDPTGTAVAAITYANVGATGSYDRVVTSTVAPTCVANVCDKTATPVSGPLAPFTEEMTLVFSGPMELYQVAVYDPAGGDYARVAYWDRCTTDGLAFVGNKSWYQCNGYVQSYVTDNGGASSPTPVQFAGSLEAGVGVNVMSSTLCTGTTDGTDCGFSRGLALHGFAGDSSGNKIFAAKFRMPLADVTPAYWLLPAQVVRSAQYGCNCRGEGADAGCGEIDIAEVLGGNTATPAHPEQATTTIYSFQGVTGGGADYFQRPVYETATFVVIFDAPSSSIAIRRLGATDFDFASTIPEPVVAQWLADAGATRAMP